MTRFAVTDPTSGEVLSEYADATSEDVEAALSGTHEAYRNWSRRTTVLERAAHAQRLAGLFREREDDLASIINRELGKPL